MASGPAERERLIDLTRAHVLREGVLDLSLSELARAIGSNNRMLLYHFGSLEDLLTEAVARVLDGDQLIGRLSELLNGDGDSTERLRAAWRHLSDPRRLPHLRLFFGRFGMAAANSEQHPAFLQRTRTEWVDTVEEALRSDVTLDASRLRGTATAVVGLWRGLQVLLISGESRAQVDRVHAAAVDALLASARSASPRRR